MGHRIRTGTGSVLRKKTRLESWLRIKTGIGSELKTSTEKERGLRKSWEWKLLARELQQSCFFEPASLLAAYITSLYPLDNKLITLRHPKMIDRHHYPE